MEKFIQFCLEELRSQQGTKNLIRELSSRITDHRGRVRQLLCSEPLWHPEVALLVMVGLAADRPLESNFLPGLLEGLLGSLVIAAPGEGNPPTSSHEGAGHAWSTAMQEAISHIEQKEVEVPGAVGLPPNLNLHYQEDFLEKQRHLVPPVFSDPLFIPKMAKAVFGMAKPPVVLKELTPPSRPEVPSAPHQPGDGGLKLEVLKPGEPIPSISQTPPQVQEQSSGASDTDSGKTDEPIPEERQSRRSLKVKLPLGLLKHSHKATTSGPKDSATPSKVQKELEAEEAKTTASTGLSEAALRKAQFQLYKKGSPRSPGNPCPDPQSQEGRGGHSRGFRLFHHFPVKAGS